MGTARRLSAMRLGGMMVVWRSAVLIPGELFGGDTDQAVPGPSANPAKVSLTAAGYHRETDRGLEACGRRTVAPDPAGHRRVSITDAKPAPSPDTRSARTTEVLGLRV